MILFLLIFGSFFRYLRIIPGFETINALPYYFILILIILITFKIIRRNIIKKNTMYLMLAITGIVITGFFYSFLYGLTSQLSYFSNIVSTLFIIYFIGVFDNAKTKYYTNSLKVFLLVSFILTFLEFYFNNILNTPLFNFSLYWDEVGVDGYHASRGNYLFLGNNLTRPWGILAMPQASGAIFAVLFSYFILILNENKWNAFYILISILGVYISASRTAMLSVLFSLILIIFYLPYVFKNQKNRFLKKNMSRLLIISLFPLFSTFIIFGDWTFTFKTFNDSFFNSVLGFYFNPVNFIRVIFGTANSGFNNSEYGLINNIISIGFLNLAFLISFVLKLKQDYNIALDSKKLKVKNLKYLIPSLTFLFSGMHYNTFRYPANIIFAIFVGLIVKNILEYKNINKSKK